MEKGLEQHEAFTDSSLIATLIRGIIIKCESISCVNGQIDCSLEKGCSIACDN